MKALDAPTAAVSDPNAIELLRVWAAHSEQHVTIATGVWNDPANWGIMLADLARHIANTYEQTTGQSKQEVFQRLKETLEAELGFPTDEVTGSSG